MHNMNSVVLFRASLAEETELRECAKHFKVITQRSHVAPGDFVIPRYSALPYYAELEADVQHLQGTLCNSYKQHMYVADLKNWYEDLKEYTPKTWFRLVDLPQEGPFVLKGHTNSKKDLWNTHMFAKDKQEAGHVYSKLVTDSMLSYQEIYIREFVELNSFGTAIGGIPITEEYRFFVFNGTILSGGFYWSEHIDYLEDKFGFKADVDSVPAELLRNVINIVSPKISFFVVDIAKTAEGNWIVIELNDGQMSGLSENDPSVLYSNLAKILK